MRLHYETRKIQAAYFRIDQRGYLYCHDCTPAERRHELEFSNDTYGESPCEFCHQKINSVTVETTAQVPVEYVTCKIF